MSKPSDFYVGVTDFFGALLPGAATLGAAIVFDVPAGLPGKVQQTMSHDVFKVGTFIVLAYVVGQLSHSMGSFVLDFIYDLLYEPGPGWLSLRGPDPGQRTAWWQHPLRLLGQITDGGTTERRDQIREQLDREAGPARAGLYQRVRAYLKVAIPDAFADLEKLEGDQKFFRALTIGALGVAVLLCTTSPGTATGGHLAGHDLACPVALVGALSFLRYLAVRRKTVERAYCYFSVRACVPEPGPKHKVANKDD